MMTLERRHKSITVLKPYFLPKRLHSTKGYFIKAIDHTASQVGYHAGKPRESVVYCLNQKRKHLRLHSVESVGGIQRRFSPKYIEYCFPENFRWTLTYSESETFSDSFLHRIFDSENFRFPFFLRKIAYFGKWNVKIKLQKIVGKLLDKLRKLYVNGTVIKKYSRHIV